MVEPKFNVPPEGDFSPHTWVIAGDLIISLTQEGAIPNEVWDQFVDDVRKSSTRRMLGIGLGSIAVNSIQRRKLVQAMHDKRVGAVLASSVARGIATALGWLGLKIRAFDWGNLASAFEYLGSPHVGADDGIALVEELLRKSGAPPMDEIQA